MPNRSWIATVRRRLPFGIGTVVGVLCVVMVVAAGVVLAGAPEDDDTEYGYGLLRDYRNNPDVSWTLTDADLPGHSGVGTIDVADTFGDTWLLAYPNGLGRAFMAIDRRSGKPLWKQPVRAGLGDCAFTDTGQIGCAIDLGDPPEPGFHLIGDDGTPSSTTDLDDTAVVFGVGPNFLRINKFKYEVSLMTPTGASLWTKRFANAVLTDEVQISGSVVIVPTTDGSQYALRRTDGQEHLTCGQCQMTLYPGGLVVEYSEAANERVSTFAMPDVRLDADPVNTIPGVRVITGPSTKPVLESSSTVFDTHGTYSVRDPASDDVWQVNAPEASKSGARPCGPLVSLARKDGSRVTFALTDGTILGEMPPPDFRDPDSNIGYLRCVGASADLMVFGNAHRLSAFAPDGRVAWTIGLSSGAASVVDGYLVLTQGTTLSLLSPS